MPWIEQSRQRYVRSPRFRHGADGTLWLHVIAWEQDGDCVLRYPLGADGEIRGEPERTTPFREAIPELEPETLAPTDDPTVEDRACAGGWRVRIERESGWSTVVADLPGDTGVPVWRAFGIAAAPAVAPASGGAWIAFHHDVREDHGRPDTAKWIAVRFVDGQGRVLEPDVAMTDRDRDREGVEQSFEFPSLAVGPDGAVVLFGRGSHNFWRQDLGADGFSERCALSDGEWGCRGRRVAVAGLSDGAVLVARRERKGIAVERQGGPRGGPPPLRPVPQVQAGEAPEEGPGAPVDRQRDPAAEDGRRTLFGDIHQHSAHSDGIGTAEEAYLRARWMYGDDFCALTDHESFLGKRIGPGEWSHLQAAGLRHAEPGRFTPLMAYEWTGRRHPGPGHKVVYHPKPGLPIVSRDDVPEGKDLVAQVKRMGAFAVPHHVGWTGADETGHDSEGQPVWEICSCHGCYEHACHPLGQRGEHVDQLVQPMLRKGLRFGFIACSDSHGLVRHHGIARKRDPFRTGLTAVQSRGHEAEEILEAIRERRCYATSGAKILLDFRADGWPMGSEFERAGPVEIRARAVGTAPIDRLELMGEDGVLHSVQGEGDEASLRTQASGPWLYVRVVQQDGEMAWSSPVFLDG